MFANFFFDPFSFTNNCFQMLNVKMLNDSGVIYKKFVNKYYVINFAKLSWKTAV